VSDHREALAKATAAMMDIISHSQAIQAAVLRSAGQGELSRIRDEAHDTLDAYLDLSTEAAVAVRSIVKP